MPVALMCVVLKHLGDMMVVALATAGAAARRMEALVCCWRAVVWKRERVAVLDARTAMRETEGADMVLSVVPRLCNGSSMNGNR